MIRLTKAPVAVPFPWATDCHFLLRAGDVIERAEFEADLAEHGAVFVYDFELRQAFCEGVDALLADAPAEAAQVKAIAEAAADPAADLPADERALLEGATELVQQNWPAYRILLARAAKRGQLIPVFALQRFCEGWSGDGLPPFAKGIDGRVTLEALGALPPILVTAAGRAAYNMLFAGEVGNSARPLPSDKSPAPSMSDKSAKGGRSRRPATAKRKSSGAKIPSRASPSTSSRSSTSGSRVDD